MKVKELIKELEIFNPEKTISARVDFSVVSHIVFRPDRIDISTGEIILIITTG